MARDYSINWSLRVREWLATQDGPRTSRQIREGLGISGNLLGRRIGVMVESGSLIKHGGWPTASYSLGREPKRTPVYRTEEERKAARREAYRRYRLRKKGEAAPKRYAKPAPKPKPEPKPQPEKVVVRLKPSPAKQAEPTRTETVDEWQRRTGRKPERLHPAACSQPLKRIGWQPGKRKQAA